MWATRQERQEGQKGRRAEGQEGEEGQRGQKSSGWLLVVMMLGFVYSTNAQESWPDPDPELLSRARALLVQVPLIDGHNDLPSTLLETVGGCECDVCAAGSWHGGRGHFYDRARSSRGGAPP
jgi:hypothetical protein